MAPHFGVSGEKKKKKKSEPGGFTWFGTGINGGAIQIAQVGALCFA
jgi:hypothetical protein